MNAQTKQKLLAAVDQLIGEGSALLQNPISHQHAADYVDARAFFRWCAGTSNILRILGDASEAWAYLFNEKDGGYTSQVSIRLGALEGIRAAVADDLLESLTSLLRAELFGDLIEQADHLLESGYFLAAGVLGRAVLEEHLRKWCEGRNCLPTRPKPTLNDFKESLYTAKHLDKLTMKHVEAMAAVGNDAAHNAPTLKAEHVERLLRDVRDFIIRNPI